MAKPVFQPPSEITSDADNPYAVELLRAADTLYSLRDSGYNLSSAVGEAIDNSIEAGATIIKVETRKSKDKKAIEAVAIADNGRGIGAQILPQVLQIGFSTRYDSRSGLGRFGMGLKTAGLSLAERIAVYTIPQDGTDFFWTFLDLKKVKEKEQKYLSAQRIDDFPTEYRGLMADANGRRFDSGTLVVWDNVDQLRGGGVYSTGIQQREADLRKFIARAYRRFLSPEKGIVIELNGVSVTLHDPLFLMPNPRVKELYPNAQGQVIDEGEIEVAGHKVQIKVSLAPEEFRPASGTGGLKAVDGRDIRSFHIAENEGRLSMIRNGREIYYDIVPRILPNGVDKKDRYIGIEVSFPGELDEFFRVMHIKRMPEPVDKLREELKTWLQRPVKRGRELVQEHWTLRKTASRSTTQDHKAARDVVAAAEREAARGRAGADTPPDKAEEKIAQVLDTVRRASPDLDQEPERVDRIRISLEEGKMNIDVAAWPGTDMFEITHLNAAATVLLNLRHEFMSEIYVKVGEVASGKVSLTTDDARRLASQVETALDLLFLAYAKAENMHPNPDDFSSLRTYWGSNIQDYMRRYSKLRLE